MIKVDSKELRTVEALVLRMVERMVGQMAEKREEQMGSWKVCKLVEPLVGLMEWRKGSLSVAKMETEMVA